MELYNNRVPGDGAKKQKYFLKSPVSQKMLAVKVCISKVGLGCENCRCIWYAYW